MLVVPPDVLQLLQGLLLLLQSLHVDLLALHLGEELIHRLSRQHCDKA